MSVADFWDESKVSPWNKTVDTSFLLTMAGDYCDAEMVDAWAREHCCIRVLGHTGRHMAVEGLCRYPVAVWK